MYTSDDSTVHGGPLSGVFAQILDKTLDESDAGNEQRANPKTDLPDLLVWISPRLRYAFQIRCTKFK